MFFSSRASASFIIFKSFTSSRLWSKKSLSFLTIFKHTSSRVRASSARTATENAAAPRMSRTRYRPATSSPGTTRKSLCASKPVRDARCTILSENVSNADSGSSFVAEETSAGIRVCFSGRSCDVSTSASRPSRGDGVRDGSESPPNSLPPQPIRGSTAYGQSVFDATSAGAPAIGLDRSLPAGERSNANPPVR